MLELYYLKTGSRNVTKPYNSGHMSAGSSREVSVCSSGEGGAIYVDRVAMVVSFH